MVYVFNYMEEDMCSHARAAKAKREAQEAIDVHSKEISTDKTEGHIAIKEHFAEAYNNVARNTESRGNSKIASILMTKLGYTEEEMSVIGDDANLMQGTGNPHQKADIKSGEIIIDLGSGFGVDAFIAANKVGSSGKVIGIDISKSEIEYSQKRALERGLQDYVLFREGDIEDIPIRDSYADCVISNGGFCLVPDKNKAFEEIYRVLKKGGRFMCLEFSKVNISSLNVLYKFWSNNVIPFLGEKVSGNRKNYEYLIESIKRFPDQSQLSSVIRSAEFKLVKHRNLSGGIAAIHSGWKI